MEELMRVARWIRGEYYDEGFLVADTNDIIDVGEKVGDEYKCYGTRVPGRPFWSREDLFIFISS
jgi:hypothetical protein